MEDVVVRSMRKEDLPQVLAVERQCFRNPWSEELFLGELRRGKIARNFVAVTAGGRPPSAGDTSSLAGPPANSRYADRETILGFIMAWQVADEIHVNNVAVSPAARKRGVAKRLITHLIDLGRGQGAVRCALEVRVSNHPAIDLYSGLGFQKAGRRRGYYSDGEDAYLLVLSL